MSKPAGSIKYKSYTDKQFSQPDLTISMTRQAFENMMTKQATLKQEIKAGNFSVSDQEEFNKLMGVFDQFDMWFEVVTL
ncbi:alkyl sulfatase C-terminal domain-containing protein [Vibrio sp. TRT 29B02]|uniref:alkyl sulfatase C-terminal domain-containing protein n=1 Tax=Vibrio sp. TRT 29B02 TaxID=3418508 RepID=UPI003CF5852E